MKGQEEAKRKFAFFYCTTSFRHKIDTAGKENPRGVKLALGGENRKQS
jgi:hypothetical protein